MICASFKSLLRSLRVYMLFLHRAHCAGLYNRLFFSAHSEQNMWPQSRTRLGWSRTSRHIGHFRRSRIPSKIDVSQRESSEASA